MFKTICLLSFMILPCFAGQETLLPIAHVKTSETHLITFYSIDELQKRLSHPLPVDQHVIEKVVEKWTPLIGKSLYPSEVAHLLFELAFIDKRLIPQQRTQNMGYMLSNLGGENPELIEKLFAFYYGYSFEYFNSR